MALQHWFTSISGSATHRVTGQWKRLSLAVDGARPRGEGGELPTTTACAPYQTHALEAFRKGL